MLFVCGISAGYKLVYIELNSSGTSYWGEVFYECNNKRLDVNRSGGVANIYKTLENKYTKSLNRNT